MEFVGYIYCVTCIPNGKLYFGQTTVNVKRRWHQHVRFAMNSKDNYRFHSAIQKYGKENFLVEEIMSLSAPTKELLKRKLDYVEIYFIKKYDSRNLGYNMTNGGDWVNLGSLSEEHKRKISESHKGDKNPMFGKHLTEEHKRKISISNRGKHKVSEEQKKKLSEANSGERNHNFGKPSWNKGIPMSEEQKRKISQKLKGKPQPWNSRPRSEETKTKISRTLKLKNKLI